MKATWSVPAITRMIPTWAILWLIAVPTHAKYGGGDGTAADPYQIWTAEQMNAIGAEPNDWDKHFKLMADIDLSASPGERLHPIGDGLVQDDPNNRPFTGVFDGNGHTISRFTCVEPGIDGVGLFRCVDDPNAVIRNLGLIDPLVDSGGGDYVGSLVGLLSRGTVIGCCTSGGVVRGDQTVGGLVGYSRGMVAASYATCRVVGVRGVGGLVGASGSAGGRGGGREGRNGMMLCCYSAGEVSGDAEVGGLVGSHYGDPIYSCVWDVETSGRTTGYGGAGKTTAEMHDPATFSAMGWDLLGPVDGPSDVWAMNAETGYPILWWQVPPSQRTELPVFSGGRGTVQDPYLITSAEQLSRIGHNPVLMESCFTLAQDIDLAGVEFPAIGGAIPFAGVFDGNGRTISNFFVPSSTDCYVGVFGLVHGRNARVSDLIICDPNINVQTANAVGALIGCLGTGVIADCNIEGGSVIGTSRTGGLVGRNEYGHITRCRSATTVSGDRYTGGLVGRIYSGRIEGCCVAGSVSGSEYTGGLAGYNAIGVISDCRSTCHVSGVDFVGGVIGDNFGTVMGCCMEGGAVSAGSCAGGLAGKNWGTITDCSACSTVIADSEAGGLAGSNDHGTLVDSWAGGSVTCITNYAGGLVGTDSRGVVRNCRSTADVMGDASIGGLIGVCASDMVANCYARGSVAGRDGVGGLIGLNGGSVKNCYATGRVSGQTAVGGLLGGIPRYCIHIPADGSFWDTQTTGCTGSYGGIGKTTAEMFTASTYLTSGWDFVGETANGTEDIWWIDEGRDYPRLWWEAAELTLDD